MEERTRRRGQNESQIVGEEKRNGRLYGVAETSKERAEWHKLQLKNLSILGLPKRKEWHQRHKESSWQERRSRPCQKKKEQSRLSKAHKITRGEDLLQKLLQALGKFDLSVDKLCGVATDGAPATVGKHKGVVSLLQKEMDGREFRHDRLVSFHCIVHQQTLCAKSVKFDHVVSVVTDCINFIKKKRDLNNRIFKQVLKDFDADYDDFLDFCAIRWTSCGNMLGRFHSLLPEIIEFRNLKKCSLTELEDENWLCDLGYMVDITKHFE